MQITKWTIVLLVSLFSFSGCTNFMTEDQILQDGVIVDMLTQKPIAGAGVKMLQHSYLIGSFKEFSQGRGEVCRNLEGKQVKQASADKRGYYAIKFDKPKYQLGTDKTYDVWYIIVSAPGYDDFCQDIYSDDPQKKRKMKDVNGRMRELNMIEMTKKSLPIQ